MADSQLISTLKDLVLKKMPKRCLKLSNMQLVDQNYIMTSLTNRVAGLSTTVLDAIARKKLDNFYQEGAFSKAREVLIRAIADKLTGYAILSHTWNGINEVQFIHLEMKDDQYFVPKTAPGYDKLFKFCQAAMSDFDMEFGWMDTVCINKTIHAELVESIRNMYKWYSDATICIVFLAGTLRASDIPGDPWFTRGWTLQELLAPKRVAFYNCTWNQLGKYDKKTQKLAAFNRNEVCLKIEAASGITPDQLYGFAPGLGQYGVATRMNWIAKRVTTREEDMAYSVMGIFDVQFDANYNEGKEAAFCRLLQAISASHTNTVHLWILNYAGKSHSNNKVTCSRILPSGPECYENHLPILNSSLHDHYRRSFKIVVEGVAVKLLLILAMPLEFNDHSFTLFCIQNPMRLRKSIEVPKSRARQIIWSDSEENPIRVDLFNDGSQSRLQDSNCFVFGVWNFEDHENHVVVPDVCAAFVFHATVTSDPIGFAVWELDSKYINPETKLDTKKVVVLRTHEGKQRKLLKAALHHYGMHYVDVFV